jgi:hypothetical protein
MTGTGWVLIAMGWLLSNVVVKLLLDLIENISWDEIDSTVKQLPRKIKDMSTERTMTMRNRMLIVYLEIVRIVAMAFFLPLFLTLTVFPFLRRIRYFRTQFQFLQTLFSRDWMVSALVLLEVFSWRGLLFCIPGAFRLSSTEETNTDTGPSAPR